MKKIHVLSAVLLLAAAAFLVSCDDFTDSEYYWDITDSLKLQVQTWVDGSNAVEPYDKPYFWVVRGSYYNDNITKPSSTKISINADTLIVYYSSGLYYYTVERNTTEASTTFPSYNGKKEVKSSDALSPFYK